MDTNPKTIEYIWIDNNYNLRSKTRVLHSKCPHCEYRGSRKCHLTEHMRTHTGGNSRNSELPFELKNVPDWTYDGSSTNQGTTEKHNERKPYKMRIRDYQHQTGNQRTRAAIILPTEFIKERIT